MALGNANSAPLPRVRGLLALKEVVVFGGVMVVLGGGESRQRRLVAAGLGRELG